ncbi:MAG: HNH endonuclease signature motif containing protein [bacterium]
MIEENEITKPTYKQCSQCKDRIKEKITPTKYKSIMRFYKTKCVVCGTRRRLELAHIVPRSVIVCNSIYNLLPMCKQHHREIFHGER